MDHKYIEKIIIIIFILIFHTGFINKLEKICMKIFFNSNAIQRPLDYCKKSYDFNIYCIGMPSGHTEVATIIGLILQHYNIISLPIVCLLIFVTGLQRIVTNMHTIPQVIIGLLFGTMYAFMYIKTDVSYKSILVMSSIAILLSVLITLYVDNKIQYDETPNWVNKDLYSIIVRKKNVPFYLKYSTILTAISYEDTPLYIDYKTLEIYLDKCIDKIQESNNKYDAIIGIKSGGAIISNYIAEKLKIMNYSVKITKKSMECNSNKLKYADDLYDAALYKVKEHKLCEGIDDNLENKNVILIDEQVDSGLTMSFVANYLLNEKKIKNLYLLTITSKNGSILLNNIPLNYIKQYKYSLIYPWGYDN